MYFPLVHTHRHLHLFCLITQSRVVRVALSFWCCLLGDELDDLYLFSCFRHLARPSPPTHTHTRPTWALTFALNKPSNSVHASMWHLFVQTPTDCLSVRLSGDSACFHLPVSSPDLTVGYQTCLPCILSLLSLSSTLCSFAWMPSCVMFTLRTHAMCMHALSMAGHWTVLYFFMSCLIWIFHSNWVNILTFLQPVE